MFDGQIMGERLPSETDQTELGLLMAGVTERPDKPLIEAVDAALQFSGSGSTANSAIFP